MARPDILASELVTPNEIDQWKFDTTRFREGYDIDQVDALLDRVVASFKTVVDKHVTVVVPGRVIRRRSPMSRPKRGGR